MVRFQADKMKSVLQNSITNLTDTSIYVMVGCSMYRRIPEGVTEKSGRGKRGKKRSHFMHLGFNIRRCTLPL